MRVWEICESIKLEWLNSWEKKWWKSRKVNIIRLKNSYLFIYMITGRAQILHLKK